jgi:hypothetical protein
MKKIITAAVVAITFLSSTMVLGCTPDRVNHLSTLELGEPAATLLVLNAENLLGIWRTSYTDPQYGRVDVEMLLQNNGRFQKQTLHSGVPITTIDGTFQVFSCQGKQCLRLNIEHGQPDEWCGPLGCIPILYPAGENYYYNLVNNNTLVLQFCDGTTAANCTWRTLNYQRG